MPSDGIDISLQHDRIFWTNIGTPSENDVEVKSCKLDGSDIRIIVPKGVIHTPKQLIIDPIGTKLYFCDREGLRVMRCNIDGTDLDTVVHNGDW